MRGGTGCDIPNADVITHDDDDVWVAVGGAGDVAGFVVFAAACQSDVESAEAATRELPLNKRSRRFNRPPVWLRAHSRFFSRISYRYS